MVGLGNPGKQYAATRHNAGFMVADELARRLGIERWKTKDSARQAFDAARNVVLLEPTSFMNVSGVPIRLVSSWYRSPPRNVLVIYDDMDLPFGTLRMRERGGHGGHNGMRSIIAAMGDDFPRIRVGVGRPQYDSIDHVLSPFSAEERRHIAQLIDGAADGVELWLHGDTEGALRRVNTFALKDRAE